MMCCDARPDFLFKQWVACNRTQRNRDLPAVAA